MNNNKTIKKPLKLQKITGTTGDSRLIKNFGPTQALLPLQG